MASQYSQHILKMSATTTFMRILNSFGINNTILSLFYRSVVQRVLTFNIIVWWSNAGILQQNNLKWITRRSLKLLRTNMETSSPISTMEQLFIDKVVKKVLSILSDNSHPLFHNYVQMRSERLRALPARTQRYRLSFVPNSIHVFNSFP